MSDNQKPQAELKLKSKYYNGRPGFVKFTYCFCERHRDICVGVTAVAFVMVSVGLIGIAAGLMLLFSLHITWQSLLLEMFFIFALPAVFYINYRDVKKTMLKDNHTEECSKKIARMAVFRVGLWSPFEILGIDD